VLATVGLAQASERSAAWDVFLGGGMAIVALVFGILSFKRRSQLPSRGLPITALVLGIVAFLLPAGAAANRADLIERLDACREVDEAWAAPVVQGLADVAEADLAAGEKIDQGLTLEQEAAVRLPLYRLWAELGTTATATDPCTAAYRPFQSALRDLGAAGERAAAATAAYRVDPASAKLEAAFIRATESAAQAVRQFERERVAFTRELQARREDG